MKFFLGFKTDPATQVSPCDSTPGGCADSAQAPCSWVAFLKRGILHLQHAAESSRRDVEYAIGNIGWRGSCEQNAKAQGEDIESRCWELVSHAENG